MQLLGVAILVSVFAVFFVASARMAGWGVAVLVWATSAFVTGLIVLGAFLATGGA